MKQVQLIQNITDLLIQFSTEIKDKGKLKFSDINIVSEDILIPILNIVFDVNLENLNEKKANFPSIDLASDEFITYGETKKILLFK